MSYFPISTFFFLVEEDLKEHNSIAILGEAQILKAETPDGKSSDPHSAEEGQRSVSLVFSQSSGSTSRLVKKSLFLLVCTRLIQMWKNFVSDVGPCIFIFFIRRVHSMCLFLLGLQIWRRIQCVASPVYIKITVVERFKRSIFLNSFWFTKCF